MKLMQTIKPFFIKHEPELLMGAGISGMIFATVYSVRATSLAIKKLQAVDEQNLTKKKKFKLVWRLYLPVVASLGVSTACIIGGNRVSNKRTAALAAAYTVSETALQEYRNKTMEIVGPKKEQQIHEAVSADATTQAYNNGNTTVVLTGDGDSLFYEPLSGRFFKTNWNKVLRAANELNSAALTGIDGTITLSDWFDKLGLAKTEISDTMGWNIDNGPKGLIEVTIDSSITPENVPCGSIFYVNRPKLLA